MANFKKNIDLNQLELSFDKPNLIKLSHILKKAISDSIKKSQKSRAQIAEDMGEMMGTEITESMLNSWTAESKKGHRFPAEMLAAFCQATGRNDLIIIISRACQGEFIDKGEALLVKIARTHKEEIKFQQKRKALMSIYLAGHEEYEE